MLLQPLTAFVRSSAPVHILVTLCFVACLWVCTCHLFL